MNIGLFLLFAFFTILPGIVLAIGAYRFKGRSQQVPGIFILLGSLFIVLSLVVHAGTYYYSFMGDPEGLASYSLTKAWLGPVCQFLGISLIAIGLLTYKKEN